MKSLAIMAHTSKKNAPICSPSIKSNIIGAVEAANKNRKTIIAKMTETYKDWPHKLHFALWGYRTSIRTST